MCQMPCGVWVLGSGGTLVSYVVSTLVPKWAVIIVVVIVIIIVILRHDFT